MSVVQWQYSNCQSIIIMESNLPKSALAANLGIELALDVAWLAGIFDGEGCLSMPANGRGVGYALRFEIFNTDNCLLDKVSNVIANLNLPHSNKNMLASKFNKLSNKPGNRVTMTQRENCVVLLEYLLPHLTSKKELSEAMIVLFKNRQRGSTWTANDLALATSIKRKFMPRSRKI